MNKLRLRIRKLQRQTINSLEESIEFRRASEEEIKELNRECEINQGLLQYLYRRDDLLNVELRKCLSFLQESHRNIEISDSEKATLMKDLEDRIARLRKQQDTLDDIFRLYSSHIASSD